MISGHRGQDNPCLTIWLDRASLRQLSEKQEPTPVFNWTGYHTVHDIRHIAHNSHKASRSNICMSRSTLLDRQTHRCNVN
ncbi:hypothetical protein BDV24DRAFT_126476 [Aspergillus arachidicola]|uniref:Uncharacterized protein n=1 Tax=Aspergillus arachidicola TaxID=656916 RepID=A0A5N6YIU3_9EURO|nr:hypothetical protein BDV24DRAFT_126476 [Aspergillus arachidicola]